MHVFVAVCHIEAVSSRPTLPHSVMLYMSCQTLLTAHSLDDPCHPVRVLSLPVHVAVAPHCKVPINQYGCQALAIAARLPSGLQPICLACCSLDVQFFGPAPALTSPRAAAAVCVAGCAEAAATERGQALGGCC